ncbi:MAG: Dabb family protein [Nevskiales bacterium]
MHKPCPYILLLLLLWLSPAALAHDPPKPPGVIHVVMVWLKEPGNPAHRQQIISGSKKLEAIPGVQEIRVGEVVESEREVVDDSFDVALYMRFASEEAMQTYLAHPDHVNAVKEYFLPIMDRYRVYDFRDE